MNKDLYLKQFKSAKQSHITHMNKLKLLTLNVSFDDAIFLGKRETALGQWFYSDRISLRSLIRDSIYQEIEGLLLQWHDIYYKIHQLFYPDKSEGMMSNFFKKRHKVSELDQDKAQHYFIELQDVSGALIRKLDSIERRLKALPEKSYNY